MKKYKNLLILILILVATSWIPTACSMSKYKITTTVVNSQAGSVSGSGEYRVGEKAVLIAESSDPNSYKWRGWYLGDRLYTMKQEFEYTVQNKNVSFEARWSGLVVNVYCYSNLDNNYTQITDEDMVLSYQAIMGSSGLEGGIEYGEKVTILSNKITDQSGYTFLGWYTDKNYAEGSKVTDGDGILNSSPFKTETYLYAKWEVKYYTLGLDSNSNLTKYTVYAYDNDTNNYTKVNNDSLKFKSDTRLKIVMENSGIESNQNTFTEWSNDINYSNVSIGESRNIYLLTMPTQDIVVSANFNLNESGFEFDNTGSTCVLVQYYGSDKVVNIPHNYKGKAVDTIGTMAFKKSSCEKVIITSLIKKIQDGAFYNVKAEIFFEDGANFNLVSQSCFESENLVYLDVKSGYNIINGTGSDNKTIRDLTDGICFVLNGNATSTKTKTLEDFVTLNLYCYLYNIDYEIFYTSGLTTTIDSSKIHQTIYNYTTNMKTVNNTFFVQDTPGILKVSLAKKDDDSNNIATLNSMEEYNKDCIENGDLNLKFNKILSTETSSYSKNPDSNRVLAVENRQIHNVCYTSEQLLFAIENGYKPLFLGECNAKLIYEKALTILRSICDDNMTDYQKTLAIHDYILNNITIDNYYSYVSSNPNFNTSHLYRAEFLEGALLDNMANRNVFKKVFSLLLSMEGIENQRYVGKIEHSSNGQIQNTSTSSWNRVKLDIQNNGQSKWYNADIISDKIIISDDNSELTTHTKFLISDNDMTLNGTKDGATITYTYVVSESELKSTTSYRENYYINKVFDNNSNLSLYFEDINANNVVDRGTGILSYAGILASNKNLTSLSVEVLIKGDVSNATTIKEIFGCTNTAKLSTYSPYGSNETYTLYVLLYEF